MKLLISLFDLKNFDILKKCFLEWCYQTEEVYVAQPKGFEDLAHPDYNY